MHPEQVVVLKGTQSLKKRKKPFCQKKWAISPGEYR